MQISREEAFDSWTAASSPWSVWNKPVLFSFLPKIITQTAARSASPASAPWAPPADGTTAIVVDLPGVQSVRVGETLARAGYRPVASFNAVPGPWEPASVNDYYDNPPFNVVDVYPIVEALGQSTLRLRELLDQLPDTAPPAFLMDSMRRIGKENPRPGDFDNRSVSLPTDFPSATFLQSRGVARALILLSADGRSAAAAQPATDLAHTLLRWQAAGIAILSCVVEEDRTISAAQAITVARPSGFGALWHNAMIVLGLRRNLFGGFGGRLPVPNHMG